MFTMDMSDYGAPVNVSAPPSRRSRTSSRSPEGSASFVHSAVSPAPRRPESTVGSESARPVAWIMDFELSEELSELQEHGSPHRPGQGGAAGT